MMPAIVMSRDTAGPRVKPIMGAGGRFAAIVDLENVAIMNDGRVSPAEMQVLLRAIGVHVSGMPVRVATGVTVLRPYMDLIGLHRWGLTLVKTEPDAADNALCDAARDFMRCGATDIVVVSGDHAFVPLAAHARLHVTCHAGHLSKALRFAATTVTYLPEFRRTARAAGCAGPMRSPTADLATGLTSRLDHSTEKGSS
jgi:hypothetical protein